MDADAVLTHAPGRVNLIGEHTDYNDGFVMPAAIGLATRVRARARSDATVVVRSADAAGELLAPIGNVSQSRTGDWRDYARGILLELLREGIPLCGGSFHIETDLPLGGGLSSSAAMEVALALALLALAQVRMEPLAIARLAQRAEVEHVGTHSGIMDQFAVLFGRAGCVTLLDARSLEFEYLAIPERATLLICNSMVKHDLAAGAYNERRAACEEAVAALQRYFPYIDALRDVSVAELEAHAGDLDPILYRRARHVLGENARVLAAASALRRGALDEVGALMNASHASLRDDYEVSCAELDTLVAIARDCPGVYGSRMTGGGFGGCTVTLVDASNVSELRESLTHEYARATGIVPQLYNGTPVDGATYPHA